MTDAFIARWKRRVVAGGVAALGDRPRSGRPDRLDPRLEAKILAKTQQPHRLERYLTSDDPDFETKAADVIGVYLHSPSNAVVFSVDEKSHIQALDRLDPVLPLSPGRAERHGF